MPGRAGAPGTASRSSSVTDPPSPATRRLPRGRRRILGRGIPVVARGGRRKRRIVGQDPALELAQPLARLDSKLFDELPARGLVGLKRVRLAVAAVESEHQLRPQGLPVGMLDDQRLELGDHLGVAAERQLGLDQMLLRTQAQVLETGDLAWAKGS